MSGTLIGFQFDTVLIEYIKSGRVDQVKSMLNEDLVKTSDDSKNTLLHYAVLGNNDAMVQHLIELGADVESPGEDGNTPLMLAVEIDNRSIDNILDESDSIIGTANTITAIRNVRESKCRSTKIVTSLLRKLQSNIVEIDKLIDKIVAAGCDLVHCVSYLRDTEIIRRMIERGFDVNSRDIDGRTALYYAASNDDAVLAKLLIDHGADVDKKHNNGGYSPLVTSAWNGSKKMMKILLEAGADPNVIDQDLNWTAILMIFINLKYEPTEVTDECLELLFQHDVIPENPSGLFNFASKQKDTKKINMLVNYLVLLKELGRPIDDSDFYCTDELSTRTILTMVQACHDFLKNVAFAKLTMFDLLTVNECVMRTHVRNNNLMFKLQQLLMQYEDEKIFPYYCSALTKRISKAKRAVELEDTAIPILCQLLNCSYNQCYNFGRDIVGYLNEKDLDRLCRVYD